jgi:proline iminopeptidase
MMHGFTIWCLAALMVSGLMTAVTAQEEFFTGADGVRLAYRLAGSGADTIVVIHGGPGTGMQEALDLEEGLSRLGHAVLRYDQRGAGNSELVSVAGKLTLASHVADLEALRRHFRLERLAVVGLGWGSAIALHYGITYPRSIDRAVFLSPMPPTGLSRIQRFWVLDSLRSPETRARLRTIDSLWSVASDTELPELCRENLRLTAPLYQEGGPGSQATLGGVCNYPAHVLRHRKLALVSALTALGAEYNFGPALQRFTRPALVIEGERSRMPMEPTRFWARHFPRGRMLLIPGAGHRTWLDRPDQLFKSIDIFLRGEWPEGSTEVPSE